MSLGIEKLDRSMQKKLGEYLD